MSHEDHSGAYEAGLGDTQAVRLTRVCHFVGCLALDPPRPPWPSGPGRPCPGPSLLRAAGSLPSGGLESRRPWGWLAGADARRAFRECWWGIGRRHTVFSFSGGSQVTHYFGMNFLILVLSQCSCQI